MENNEEHSSTLRRYSGLIGLADASSSLDFVLLEKFPFYMPQILQTEILLHFYSCSVSNVS